jgi:hypothetical protein
MANLLKCKMQESSIIDEGKIIDSCLICLISTNNAAIANGVVRKRLLFDCLPLLIFQDHILKQGWTEVDCIVCLWYVVYLRDCDVYHEDKCSNEDELRWF